MTLRSLRTCAGLELEQVAAHVSIVTGKPCATVTVHQWEHRGVQKVEIIVALSSLYQRPLEDIIAAAAASRAGEGPKQKRGRVAKNILQNVV